MVPFTIDLDDNATDQLRRRAEPEGVPPSELAARLLAAATSGRQLACVCHWRSAIPGGISALNK